MSTFAIVNLRDGVRRDITPFLIDNDAFPILENAYLFRGRIEKRSCFTIVGGNDGRLKGTVGTTDGAGNLTLLDGTVPGGIPEGVATFIINGQILTDPGGANPVTLLHTGAITGTLNRTTGVLSTSAFNTAVVYIPGLPVMGLRVKEQDAINDELLQAFDTRYTYIFDISSNDFILQNTFQGVANTFVWTGTDSDLFWSCNYQNAFWATNNVAGYHAALNASPVAEKDGIRWFGTTAAGTGWSNFNPPVSGTDFLNGSLLLIPYKDRLVALNTLEGANLGATIRFPQRARWSQNGTVFYNNFPVNGSAQANAWRSDVVGRGGFIDAPTQEAITAAEFVKDTLIVYFERSTWQLVYTNNEVLPFVWQKINTELGCESTFSIVPFDSGVFAVGNYGIVSTDSVQVTRIDQKIPDEVFQIQNLRDGVKRVFGIRDYNAQLVYWTFPVRVDESGLNTTYPVTYPNQVLVFNYLDGAWAEFDDSFTCFGYWQKFSDTTWQKLGQSWQSVNFTWNSQVLQARYPDVIAGNQRGFVFVYSQLQNLDINSASLPIGDITVATRTIKCVAHNLVVNDYILISGVQGTTGLNGNIFKILSVGATGNDFVIDGAITFPITGTYTGGGVITVLPNFFIQTKQFNPFYEKGDSVRLNYIDIYTDRTSAGEFTAQFFTNSNTSQPLPQVDADPAIPPNPVVLTRPETATAFSANQERIWHRIYANAFGSFFQNVFTFSDAQMRILNVNKSDVTIHGLVYYVSPAGRISYDI